MTGSLATFLTPCSPLPSGEGERRANCVSPLPKGEGIKGVRTERAARARAKDLLAVGPHERQVLRICGKAGGGPGEGTRRHRDALKGPTRRSSGDNPRIPVHQVPFGARNQPILRYRRSDVL